MKAKKLVGFFIATFLSVIALAGSSVVFYLKNDMKWCTAFAAVGAVIAILMIAELCILKKGVTSFVTKINSEMDYVQRDALWLFPEPLLILNEHGMVLWYNKVFCEEIAKKDNEAYGHHITSFIDINLAALFSKKYVIISYNGRNYKVRVNETDKYEAKLLLLCFEDVTNYVHLQEEMRKTRQSVVLITIDNYEELFRDVRDSEKALALVKVERLLEEFMGPTTGILKKMGSDKYVGVVEEQHLEKIVAERFKILDEARKIKVDEKTELTLSIGVGRGAKNLEESENDAKQALDMVLGRGGDQAAIKSKNGFEFFGGVSKGIEKQSKIKTRVVASAFIELIHNAEKVYIMGHRLGDLDSVGGAIGLAGAINKLGKQTFVVVDPIKNLAQPLIERIKNAEGDKLFLSPDDALAQMTDSTLLVIVDTYNKDLVESADIYRRAKQVAVIDHHRKTVNYIENALVALHEPFASSASELITELIQYFPNLGKIPSHYAEALLSGIILDTKSFVMKSGVRTFEAAAYLKKMGADTITVKSFFANSIESYQKKTMLVAAAEIYKTCAITESNVLGEDIRIVAPQAADELLTIKGVDASFVIYKIGDIINVSARSMGAMNVQLVMEILGGGGHQTMAAAQLKEESTNTAKLKLIEAIDKHLSTLSEQK
ncbi:MAG: DHH family phosphoesterase [Oscillospiraceae bacterium]|nr:DHH family phosphoesterase [Oscillospiraceae bacterium]